jgi:arsenate reductase (thioredoxin)
MAERVRVVFVCVGNACRSQIAEALAKHLAADLLDSSSAGISPLGRVPDATRRVLKERGVAHEVLFSKGMSQAPLADADFIVNLTGIPGKALFSTNDSPKDASGGEVTHANVPGRVLPKVMDWDVHDPYGDDVETYRLVCDDIEQRLQDWIAELRAERAGASDAAASAAEADVK